MTKTSPTQGAPISGLPPMHPGELLREEVIPATGKTQQEIADHLGVSRQALVNILSEKAAVSPAMALKLGKLFGNGPDLWINLQSRWDLAQAEAQIGAELAKIPTLPAVA